MPDDSNLVRRTGLDTSPVTKPLQFDQDTIESVLWEVAVAGGNVAKAMRQLRDHDLAGAESNPDWQPRNLPTVETVRRWIRVQFRNRYHEISQGRGRQLEELRAHHATELAIRQADVEEEALKVVQARLSEASAKEASEILRNVSTSKKIQGDAVAQVRGQRRLDADSRSLSQIADSLKRLGAAVAVEAHHDIEEADVVEEPTDGGD